METILDNTNFEKEVLQSPIPILVDFWAEWCRPCLVIAPVLKEIGDENPGKIRIGKLNVDQFPDIAMKYNVASIPNMKVFKGGQIAEEIVGAQPKAQILKKLEKFLQ